MRVRKRGIELDKGDRGERGREHMRSQVFSEGTYLDPVDGEPKIHVKTPKSQSGPSDRSTATSVRLPCSGWLQLPRTPGCVTPTSCLPRCDRSILNSGTVFITCDGSDEDVKFKCRS